VKPLDEQLEPDVVTMETEAFPSVNGVQIWKERRKE
jgi:hypothetical protein